MRHRLWSVGLYLAITMIAMEASAQAKMLAGKQGVSSEWSSSWLDLTDFVDFKKGDRIRLTIGGTAQKILIRLLPRGATPDDPVGFVGDGPFAVPKARVVTITLSRDFKGVAQISVHGGPNPWGVPLGPRNGAATLLSVERLPR